MKKKKSSGLFRKYFLVTISIILASFVFLGGALLLFVSGLLTFFYLRKINRTGGWWRLVAPFKIAIFVPFLLLLILAIDFDWMFVMFHNILFNNDAWIFSAVTDPIITVLPQEFFMYTFIFAFILIEAFFIGGYFFSKRKAYNEI